MKTSTILRITLMGLMACQVLSLPIEKELLRVKRKGELDEDGGGHRLHRRDLTPDLIETLENDLHVRRKRRFEPKETNEDNNVDKFPNKMAARSSRSSREDNDVTARGMERFLIREIKNKGIKQPAKRFIAASGSGMESDVTSGSGSGVWISDAEASNILSRGAKSMSSALENIVASLGDSDDESSSGSGTWTGSGSHDASLFSTPVSQAHYAEVGRVASGDSSGTGDKPASLVSDLSEELQQQTAKQDEEHPKQKRSSETDQNDILHKFFEGSQIIHRARREKIDNGLEERLASFFKNLQGDVAASHHPDSSHEPPPIPAVVTSKKKSKVTKTARDVSSSQGNDDVLTGINLVKRFYRDQGMKENKGQIVYPDSVTPLGEEHNQDMKIETKELEPQEDEQNKAEDEGTPVEPEDDLQGSDESTTTTQLDTPINQDGTTQETSQLKDEAATNAQNNDENSHDKMEGSQNTASGNKQSDIKRNSIFEPRVLSEKKIPKTHVTIIEEPAVYSSNDDEMDSDDGGRNADEEESEPAIEIHERDIREDGYVGCYADRSPDRDLPIPVSVRNITPKTCRMACKDAGHAYAGLQYGYLCRCGDNYGKYQRLAEEQCSTACKGDKTQICGGFFRSSIYATEGVTEPTQGEFLHVESVRPLNAPIRSQSATPNYMPPAMPYLQPNPLSYSSAAVQLPAPSTYTSYIAPQEPKIIYHSETPLNEAPAKPVVKNEVTKPPKASHGPQVTAQPAKKSTIVKPAHAPKPTPSNVIRQPHYLHKQVAAVVKKTKKKQDVDVFGHLTTNPATQIFTGSIKLKQNWLDNLNKPESPAYKILSGNIEEAFKKMFKKDAKFISAKVHGFRKGLVKHNPATIRKVVAAFSLTFQRGANGIENKVAHDIKEAGKLVDMPAFSNSIKIQEYNKMAVTKPSPKKIEKKRDTTTEEKRDIIKPKSKLPYTLELFLMKDQLARKRRSEVQ